MRMFLEWVFWRQGAGFSMSTSEYHRVPAGAEMLGMTDEGFGSMGFTHDEVCRALCWSATIVLRRRDLQKMMRRADSPESLACTPLALSVFRAVTLTHEVDHCMRFRLSLHGCMRSRGD